MLNDIKHTYYVAIEINVVEDILFGLYDEDCIYE